jgi:Na+/proline symporter
LFLIVLVSLVGVIALIPYLILQLKGSGSIFILGAAILQVPNKLHQIITAPKNISYSETL